MAVAAASLISTDDGTRYSLTGETTIGRADANALVVTATGASRFHAVIREEPAGHRLHDLGSRNGTFVNGAPVQVDGQLLADGDLVVVGGSVAFRYLDPQATPLVPRIGKLEGVWIDPDTDEVWVDARLVSPELSARQFQLLTLLVEADGAMVSRPEIVAAVWPEAEALGVSDDAVTALVKRLRARLREHAVHGDPLEIVRGRGIRLAPPGP